MKEQLLKKICEINDVDYNFMIENPENQNREFVDARRMFAFIYFNYERYSYKRIGLYLKKDHATIMDNVKTHNKLFETDKIYKNRFEKVFKCYMQIKQGVNVYRDSIFYSIKFQGV